MKRNIWLTDDEQETLRYCLDEIIARLDEAIGTVPMKQIDHTARRMARSKVSRLRDICFPKQTNPK